jgi:hypothetical protein
VVAALCAGDWQAKGGRVKSVIFEKCTIREAPDARAVTAVTNAQTAQVLGRATNAAGRASFGGLSRPPDVHLLQRVSMCEYRDNIQSDTRCFDRASANSCRAARLHGTRATCTSCEVWPCDWVHDKAPLVLPTVW